MLVHGCKRRRHDDAITVLPELSKDLLADVAAFLHDRDVSALERCSHSLRDVADSASFWAVRAAQIWSKIPGFTEEEQRALLSASAEGRNEYVKRRTLLLGWRVCIYTGRRASSLSELVELCGGLVVGHGELCTLAIIGRGGVPPVPRLVGRTPRLMSRWLFASVAVGHILPAHRLGCQSDGGVFSQARSCIAPSGLVAGAALCCYAARLLEGLLVSTSGIADQMELSRLVAIIQALGGEYRERLSPAHTHLVAADASGPNFAYAQRHNILVVSSDWVLETLRLGRPLNERCFAVRHQRF